MISKQTQKDAVQVIKDWCQETGIPIDPISDLMTRLSKVHGSSHWKDVLETLATTLMMEIRK